MKFTYQLAFNGDCAEAFEFYQKLFGGKIISKMTWGESPMGKNAPAEWKPKIIHATLIVGETVIGGGDAPPGHYQKPQGTFVGIDEENPEKAEKLYNALAEKGTVVMKLGETFWAKRFGMVYDRFGTPWLINCGKPQMQ